MSKITKKWKKCGEIKCVRREKMCFGTFEQLFFFLKKREINVLGAKKMCSAKSEKKCVRSEKNVFGQKKNFQYHKSERECARPIFFF